MKTIKKIILFSLILFSGCVSNDIPKAGLDSVITAFELSGGVAEINPELRTVTITLDELTDICNVNVTKVEFNSSAVVPSVKLVGNHNFTQKMTVTLNNEGQESVWTISAQQNISKFFTVDGQVGATVIDEINHRIVLKVSPFVNRKELEILSICLGPESITTYEPAPATLHDFSNGQEIVVTCHGRSATWSIYVEITSTLVELVSADAWTRVAWLKGSGIAGEKNGFRYRKAGDEQWLEVPDVQETGGVFQAMIDSLAPMTSYECLAYCGDDESEVATITTEGEMQLPNPGFEVFSHAESDKYYSFFDPASSASELQTKWWGSGNKGSTTVGSSYAITLPDTETFTEGSASLKMMSQYVVIKFAAGNVFSGEFSHTIGTSGGVIRLGRPFTLRPRKLSLMLKYKCGKIEEHTLGGYPPDDPVKVGDNDRGVVWVALGKWDYRKYGGTADSPVMVNTNEKSTFFDPKGEDVIAYGKFVTAESINEWTKVEIPLEYYSTSVHPTHIIVSCAASLLGDYFTGSADSILWIDDIKLEY
ncbi:MAG: PCMD domain-containing protein [Bacteroidales bacterium]|nr:PCMD domain-containing protein [Bacteroidales bacterium]